MRTLITFVTLFCFVGTQTIAVAGPSEEGLANGNAAIPVINGNINAPNASAVVPGYTTAPPENAYYGNASLTGKANARLAACSLTPNDPVCQAQTGATNSANTPRPPVGFYDPAVVSAHEVTRNPSNTLGDLSSYYSGCATNNTTVPTSMKKRLCHRYAGVGNYSCSRNLNVAVNLKETCKPGTWFAQGQVDRNGADHMYAQAYCEPMRADGLQRFRVFATGENSSCIPWQTLDLSTNVNASPQILTDLSPHWNGYCWNPFKVVLAAGSGCSGTACNYTFQFGTPVYACPSGQKLGDKLFVASSPLGAANACFSVTQDSGLGCTTPAISALDAANNPVCAQAAGPAAIQGVNGWTLPLSFTKPGMTHEETDTWDDQCPALSTSGRCSITTPDICVDGPSTKKIDRIDITRACWQYTRTLTCDGGTPLDECVPLAAQGCTPLSTQCKQTNAATGSCEIFEDTYQCPVASETVTNVGSCPTNVFCIEGSCFNTSYTKDTDFARSMSMMEAAREAGVYIDTANLQIFKGESNQCRDKLLKNCCYTDGAGAGMTNQSMFGTGSRLVYDVLTNSDNQQFIYQGMQALISGAGFSGSFSTYGVTVAVNGAAVPAGSVVVASSESVVVAFDPWSLAIAVIIYIVMSMMSCNEEEGKLAMKKGAGLCHEVGTYCSSSNVFGCTEHKTASCCFNSKLARIVNEQGRVQISKGWGTSENPNCSGFTIAQLQSLNFAAMDLSEFYASIVPTIPNVTNIQTTNGNRIPSCYYGQGRCQ